MKTKILLTAIILTFAIAQINAQAHDNSRGACRLFKNKAIEEGASCPGCVAKDKKEQAARDVVNKKRQDIATAKANAERLAKETAYKKEMAERKAKEKVTEVKVVMPKSSVVKSNTIESESDQLKYYKVENGLKLLEKMSELNSYNTKILYKDKVVFDSNEFLYLKAVWGKLLFVADYPKNSDSCKESESNKSVLLDKNGKKINLEGIDKFGFYSKNDDNDGYFDIVVYTGQCTPVENDRYANADWHTIIYTFDYNTKKLISSKPSWQHSSCHCN